MSSTFYWLLYLSAVILVVVTGITFAVLLIERSKGNIGPSSFNCQMATPPPFPVCASSVVTSGVPGILGTGFFTASALKITPTYNPGQVTNPDTTQLTGYYHAHPTGYYQESPGGALYSYPFVLRVSASGSPSVPPSMQLSAYRYSSNAVEVANSPFDQFAYLASGLNGYSMTIPCANGGTPAMPNLTVDFEPYPATGGPTLTSMLASRQASPGFRSVRLILNQGTPYMMLALSDTLSAATMIPTITTSSYLSSGITNIIVSSPPSRTFTTYTFWYPGNKCLVWFVNAATTQSLTVVGDTATLNLGTLAPGDLEGLIYVTMLSEVGPLLINVIQLLADSLIPHFIQLSDIIPTTSNTAMQYTIVPIPGYSLDPGNSTLWIVPPTSFQVAGLAAVTLPSRGYLDFPTGNGIFQTNPQVGPAVFTSFFTLWPKAVDPISDFSSYTLSNAGVTDTSDQVTSDADMYYLALTLRTLMSTFSARQPSLEQINSCISTFSSKINAMGVSQVGSTIFTPTLGTQDAGLVSRISYLLLTFLHLHAINPLLPANQSNHGLIVNAGPALTMLVESGLTTASLAAQAATSGIGIQLYTPLAFLDAYSCTVPVIKTTGLESPAVPTLPQLTSRLGEVLGYLWSCDFLVRNGFVNASSAIPFFARSLYSITLEATTRLLRGQCATSSVPSLAPVMPWTTCISNTNFGFQLDGASPGGNSPDATLLQTFTPFSPPTHLSIRPLLNPLTVSVDKLLKCTQSVPQASPAQYFFGGYVDPELVGYYTYLYTSENRSQMLLTGKVDTDLKPFVKIVSLQHPAVALLMNQVKLGVLSQPLVTHT